MFNFLDRVIMQSPRKTADGYLVGDVACARIGCQQYHAAELGLDGDGIVTVYRPESAVFDEASLVTYAGKPVTVSHPPELVTADNWKKYAVGDIGAKIARDGDFVVVPYKIMDADAIAAIEAGAREVSMGYTTPVEFVDGVAPDGTPYQAVQTGPIRINHLAVVPKARGGSELRIGDSAKQWGASPIAVADSKGGEMPDILHKIVVDGFPVEVNDTAKAVIVKLQSQLADAMAANEKQKKEADDELAEKEKELAKRDAAISALESAKLSDADIEARAAARADLLANARLIAKDAKFDGLSNAEIRKVAVVAALGDAAIDGKSEAYIDARFDILVEGAANDPMAKPIAGKVTDSVTDFYAERNKALQDQWKGK